MSSAALQAASHQSTAIPPPLNSEGYYARDNANTGSSSSKRPSKNDQRDMTSRTAVTAPVPVTGAEYQQSTSSSSPSSRRRRDPPVAPPRTSSSQQGSSQGSSRRAARAEERAANSPRRQEYEESSSRGKQRVSSRDGRQSSVPTTLPIRTSTTTSSKQPSREASEVLNRVIVSQPEVDLQREQARLDEAQPNLAARPHDDYDDAAPPPVALARDPQEENSRRGGRSRHDHSKKEKGSKFGDYYLGNTIGEGEFGKVKLGWKQEDGVQVAIKLIRRDSVGNNPSRLAKIYREVAILRGVSHPNIVRLHEMSETERHIGIVLEYASGGELFDYILNHKYLKDGAARRLFAQLVSGVGYLHKKGIVHRDLKLENLLLDRNRNIIITDFGFANTFDPNDELSEEQELGLGDREFVKRTGLDKTKPNGMRRGDLMQTSCGSPCYAAPELVVSDSLYTGRKVDVWSCGVILYAMLAGYLPFDDDPANPEGDNINLLYKYIVNTPLTFPEYVTPHARDLLRRILVPSPRKRADLFEVARHSWLSEYAHVVEFITSSTTTSNEIQNTTVPAYDEETTGGLARSASVREPSKPKPASTIVGDLTRKQGTVDSEEAQAKQHRDNKRRTVQVEYVAPTTQTQRGGEASVQASPRGKTKARSSSQGPIEVQHTSPVDKPLPRDPPTREGYNNGSPSRTRTRPPSTHKTTSRSNRDARAASETGFMPAAPRPATRGSVASIGSRHGVGVGGRASYGQPVPPTVAGTNVLGRMSQPKSATKNHLVISNPASQTQPDLDFGRPSVTAGPKSAQASGFDLGSEQANDDKKGHRRSNTIGEIGGKLFGRSGSIFGGRKKRAEQQQGAEKAGKKYPPVSMANVIPNEGGRQSMDSRASRRSFSQSLGLNKKRSGSISGSQTSQEKPANPRRFSLLRAMGITRDTDSPPPPQSSQASQGHLPIQDPPQVDEYGRYMEYTDGSYDETQRQRTITPQPQVSSPTYSHNRYASTSQSPNAMPAHLQRGGAVNSGSEGSFDRPQRRPPNAAPYPAGYDSEGVDQRSSPNRGRGVLQKNKRFVDAYDGEGFANDHAGSSGAAKRVMAFFRRRGKARGEGA